MRRDSAGEDEAYVERVRCGVASTHRTGNYSGYVLSIVGPEAVAGCAFDVAASGIYAFGGRRCDRVVAAVLARIAAASAEAKTVG